MENGAWGKCLVWFIQSLWLCTILKDLDNTYSICAATMRVKKGRRTRMVLADLRDEGDEAETSAARPDSGERPEATATEQTDDDFHNPGDELGGFMRAGGITLIAGRTATTGSLPKTFVKSVDLA
jgi:hypothetical protein